MAFNTVYLEILTKKKQPKNVHMTHVCVFRQDIAHDSVRNAHVFSWTNSRQQDRSHATDNQLGKEKQDRSELAFIL